MTNFRIVITQNADPVLVEMLRKAYHKAHGTKGFSDPDIIVN